jgi:FkbM family methyltransferase
MPFREPNRVAHQKFWQDGGIDLLASVEDVKEKNVIVLGGYLGDSVDRYLKLGANSVDVFEPVLEYFEKLGGRFQGTNQVNLIHKAAWIRNETLEFWLDSDGTGFSGKTGTSISVEAIRLSDWLSTQEEGKKYFIEINIEGSEYALLEDLISTGMVNRLATILVQFHNFTPESECQRENIRNKLANYYSEKMNYEWVWEKWISKESVDKYL